MMFGGRHMRGLTQEVAKPVDVSKTLRRLGRYFRPFWGLLLVVFVLIVVSTAMQTVALYLPGVAVNQFIELSDQPQPRPAWLEWLLTILSPTGPQVVNRTSGLTIVMLLLLGTNLFNWAAMAGQIYLMTVVGQRVLLLMRTQIFERIHNVLGTLVLQPIAGFMVHGQPLLEGHHCTNDFLTVHLEGPAIAAVRCGLETDEAIQVRGFYQVVLTGQDASTPRSE